MRSPEQREVLDGLATIALVFIAVGLMAAIHTSWDKPNLLMLRPWIKSLIFNAIASGFGRRNR